MENNIINLRKRDPLKGLMTLIKELDKKKIITTLSILPSGMNDPIEYTRVSFKIPKKY